MESIKWLTWFNNKDDPHAVHVTPKPRFDLPHPKEEWQGLAKCGATIPARGTYPPSQMSGKCPRCVAELKRIEREK